MRIARFFGLLGLSCFSSVSYGQLIADFCFCDPANVLNNAAGVNGIKASPGTVSNGEGIYNNNTEESLDVDIPASIFQGAESVTLEFDFYNQKDASFLINAGGAEEPRNDPPNGDPFRIGNKALDNGNGNVGMVVVYYTTADPTTPIKSGFIPGSAIGINERATIIFIYDRETGTAQLFKNNELIWETPADQRTPGEGFYLETKTTDGGQEYLTVGYNMNRGAKNTPSLYYFRAYDRPCPTVPPPSVAEVARCGPGVVTLRAGAPGVADGAYRWYADRTGTALAGEVNSTFAPTLTQSTTYYVSVLEGPCESERVPIVARIITPPPAPAVTDQERCEPAAFTLRAEGPAGSAYQWYAADGVTPLDNATRATYTTDVLSESTDFYVAAITEGCQGALAKVSARVLIPPPAPTINKVVVCEPGTASLTVERPTDGLTYRWYDQPANGTLLEETTGSWDGSVTSDTTFYVSAWNGSCESKRVPAPVTIFAADDLDAGPDVRVIPDGTAPLQATPGYARYEWSPAEGLNRTDVADPVASPDRTTTYYVTVTTASGCEATDAVTVEVVDYPIPNAFTPNGDGLNDQWELAFLERYPNCEVAVYNRWGELVYHSTGYAEPWDGRYAGQAVVLGTYTYVLDLGNGKKPVRGSLVVLK